MVRPRRGLFRPRPLRRLMRAGGLLAPRPRQLLNQAHGLMAAGNYTEAAQLFAQLSDGAAERGIMDRAGNLSLQAARAFIESGNTANAMSRIRQGLRWLLQAGRESRAARVFQQAVSALRARNLNDEADALLKEFPNLASAPADAEVEPAPRGHLPPKCPNCGGPIRVDDADWIDDATAECPWCGSPVRTDGA